MLVLEGPQTGQPIPRGSLIVCMECKIVLIETKITLHVGTAKISGHFESREKEVFRGMSATCPGCGNSFMTRGSRMYYIAPPRSFGARLSNFMWRTEG